MLADPLYLVALDVNFKFSSSDTHAVDAVQAHILVKISSTSVLAPQWLSVRAMYKDYL